MSVSCRYVVGIMKRHLCRHCGLALESYAALRSHLESHPSENEHSYSIAPSGVRLEDPSQDDRVKKKNSRVNAKRRLKDGTICDIT